MSAGGVVVGPGSGRPPSTAAGGPLVVLGQHRDDLRRRNLGAVLDLLHRRGLASRSELVGQTGLNRSTIKVLVDQLTLAGLVQEELPVDRSGAGRPSLVCVPRPETAAVAALHVAVHGVDVALVGLGGHELARLHVRHPSGPHSLPCVVDRTSGAVEELLATLAPGSRLVGVGVGVAGAVRADGLVRSAPNLGWTDVPLGRALEERLGRPVVVGNDADLGVVAEHRRGCAIGVDDVLYLHGEVGVGGGVLLGGQLVGGAGGYLGEVGHVKVRRGGRRCRCGARGCWETEIGEDNLLRLAGRRPGSGQAGLRQVIAAARAGETRACAAVDEVAHWLASGTASLVNLLNPALVVFGGALADLFSCRAEVIRTAVTGQALRASGEDVLLRPAALGADAVLLGAAELAFAPLLDDPLGTLGEAGAAVGGGR